MIYVAQAIDQFVSTNAINPTVAYSGLTTYAVGEEARIGTIVYKSTIADNLDSYPPENLEETWIDWDVANDYAMLDPLEETATNWTGDGIVVFARGSMDTIGIGKFNSTQITIEYLDAIDTVLETETYNFSYYTNMYDPYTYGYGGFEFDSSQVVYKTIQRIGVNIRVTFSNSGNANYCGFLIAGYAQNMGDTLNKVQFRDIKYGKRLASESKFNTIMDKNQLMNNLSKAKQNINNSLMFVIDPSESSSHNNMVVLGKIKDYSGVGELASKNEMSWTIEQEIRK